MAKFKLFWENNPETPLSAERLSGFIDHYSTDSIIYSDDDLFLNNGDGRLKIRGLTKLNHLSHKTLSAFGFDQSLTSFNSKFAPKEKRDVVFRDEYYDKKGSAAFDESITNILTNSGFEDGGAEWTFFRGESLAEPENSDIDSTIEYTTEDFYPNLNINNLKSAKITTGTYRGKSRLIKYIPTPSELANFSLSFYYKVGQDCHFTIKSGTLENPQYFNNLSGWQGVEKNYTLEATDKWKRYELPGIMIGDQTDIRLEITVVETESVYYFDSFLLEQKPYCSSYYYRDTDSTILSYSKDSINYMSGLIDFTFYPKHKGDKNTFFALKSQDVNNDAIRLEYDGANNRFIISIFDANNSNYIENYSYISYDSMINRWNRCIFNWDLNEKKINMVVIKLPMTSEESTDFTILESEIIKFSLPEGDYLFNDDDLEAFYIGSNAGLNPARSLMDFFKINKESKSLSEIVNDINSIHTQIDEPTFKMFESGYQSIIINESLLDEGSFNPNTKYYVWLGDNENDNSCDILVSQSPDSPKSYKWFDSTVIGGFHTDIDGSIDLTSFWDKSTRLTDTFHTDRLLIGNTRTKTIDNTDISNESSETPIEFKTYPTKEATFNIDSYFTKHIYGRNRNDGNFLDINNATGEVFLDNLHFDGYTIESIGSNLEITAEQNTVDIHSNEITLTSTGIDIKLDDIRVLDNKIYTKDGSDLIINTREKGNNNFQVYTDLLDIDSGITNIQTTNELTITTGTNMTINTGNDFIVNSGSLIRLDDLIIDDNVLYRDANFRLRSVSSYVEIEDVKFNNNKIFYGDEEKRYIQFYTDDTDPSLENIDIASDNLIKIDSPRFEVTANEIVFHANMANYFRLEDLRVDGSKLFTDSGTSLKLGGDGTELSESVYIKATNNINLNSTNITLTTSVLDVNVSGYASFDNIRINDNTVDSMSGQLNIGNTTEKTFLVGSSFEFNTGSVAVGFSSPKEKLDVNGNIRLTGDIGFGSNAKVIEYIDSNNQSGAGWTGKDAIKMYGDGSISNLALYVGHIHTTGASEIQGQLTLGDKLNVASDLIFKAADTGDIIFRNTDSSEKAKIHSGTSDGNNVLNLGTAGSTSIHIDSLQNVGIKNTSPSKELDVSGSGNFSDNLTIGNTLTAGNISGSQGSFQSSSLYNNSGYIETPWLYVSGGIEADERGAQGTGVFFNDGVFAGSGLDTITFVTSGERRMQVKSDGGVTIGNSGTLVGSSTAPVAGNWLTYNGNFQAHRVYNAVWMDLAECWYKDDNYTFEYGMTVVQTKNGLKPSTKRAEKGTVGILSNTYGYLLGAKDFDEEDFTNSESLPVAISGRVEAKYEGKLEIGDEVVSTKKATLIRANFIEKIIKRDRIIGRVDEVLDDKKCKIKVY